MDMSLMQLGIDRLNVAERLELIGKIWDTLPGDSDLAPPEWHLVELDRRLAAAEADPEAGVPWDIVKARLTSQP